MKPVICFLADWLPGEGPTALAAHRAACLRCRTGSAYRSTVRGALSGMADEVVPAPAGLQARVLARLGEQDAADPRRALVARATARYAAAAGVVGATVVALAAGLARRHQRALG